MCMSLCHNMHVRVVEWRVCAIVARGCGCVLVFAFLIVWLSFGGCSFFVCLCVVYFLCVCMGVGFRLFSVCLGVWV